MSVSRFVARGFSQSMLLGRGRRLFDLNQANWELPLSKLDKAVITAYLVSKGYAAGEFPPTFEDQGLAYQAEINYSETLPGISASRVRDINLRKPFWGDSEMARYLHDVVAISAAIAQNCGPQARILELGCGSGWLSEMLATMGYSVVGTTISPHDVEDANLRIAALRAKRIEADLQFVVTPMEDVFSATKDHAPFDCVIVYEALHHAFDWRQTCASVFQTLRPGGVFLICAEPNLIHTFTSYRVALLSKTHEIGFSRRALRSALREIGFQNDRSIRNKIGLLYRSHWLAAEKP